MQPTLVPSAPAIAGVPVSTKVSSWTLDPVHSSVNFSVRHMMISKVHGAFLKFTASIVLDRAALSNSSITASIEANSIDTRELKRDEHLRSAEFFDVAVFPTLTFKSRRFEPQGPYENRVVGDLTIHGITREVTFFVESALEEMKDPYGNIKIGMSANAKVNRKDFGLAWNSTLESGGFLVGDEVSITMDLQFTKTSDR